jgi:predicted transcriptional regulator
MNYHTATTAKNGRTAAETNEQRLLTLFADTGFTKEDAADALGITVSGAYKLLQKMVGCNILAARKEGKRWVYG